LARARVRSQVESGTETAKSCFALLDKLLSFRNDPESLAIAAADAPALREALLAMREQA
jgi:hypothetical protein